RGERVDKRADIYALGLILYECLTGVKPFVAPNVIDHAKLVANESPKPPSVRRKEVPPELDAVVLHAMAKTPGARPRDCGELGRELREARGKLRARKTPQKKRGAPWALLALLGLGVLLAGGGVIIIKVRPKPTPAPPPAPPKPAPPTPAPPPPP